MAKLPKYLEEYLKIVEEIKKENKLERAKQMAKASKKKNKAKPRKTGKTKAAESVDHLTELHKLQGTLLNQLKKQV